MNLKNIAIIVDGQTEELSLRKKLEMIYHSCPNLRLGPGNGITFTIEGYAKGVIPNLIYLLNSNVRAIILIPDLEKRKVTPEIFAKNLKNELIKQLLNSSKFDKDMLEECICVCPPNIMFENWIISDIVNLKDNNALIDQKAVQKLYDGKNGASELQKIMTTKYKKTIHAQTFFKKIKDENSSEYSNSYKYFITNLEELIAKHCH